MPYFRPEPPHILLIEKDPQVLGELSAALLEANYQIQCCHGVKEAMEQIDRRPPDAIICNVVMNELSGSEFRDRVKRQGDLKDVPVMFLSPSQASDIIRRHDNHGGSYCLRKPCDPQVLLQLLENMLELAPAAG
jgi:putative two-component system response regulator